METMTDHDDPADLPPGVRLLWDGEHAGREPKPALSLERIVREAIAVADAEGLGALSMQRLARQLGAGTMSLYRHVPGKQDLVSLMFDTVLGDAPRLPAGDWLEALRTWAVASREAFRRHPWMLEVVAASRVMGPNEVAWSEVALRAMSETGLPAPSVFNAVLTVNGYVRGIVQLEVDPARGREGSGGHQGPSLDPVALRTLGRDRYPTLMALLAAGAAESGTEGLFEFGLERILDGIAAFVNRQRPEGSSPAPPGRTEPPDG
jgi:AcrR family transcriptional regulator